MSFKQNLCIVIGDPVEHSLSPKMHQFGYEALNLADTWRFAPCHVRPENLESAVSGIRALSIRGASVTLPHKEAVIPYLDSVDPLARRIGAVNTIVNDNGYLTGYNTDYYGIVDPLNAKMNLQNERVLLMGAGGAARAAAIALSDFGALVTIVNRTDSKANYLANQINNLNVVSSEFNNLAHCVSQAKIIVNCTSVGMVPNLNQCLIEQDWLTVNHVVFDTVYTPQNTLLLKRARLKGAVTIFGTEINRHQLMLWLKYSFKIIKVKINHYAR
jgi:shikimate dehydrogenase